MRVHRIGEDDCHVLSGHRDEISSVQLMQHGEEVLVLSAGHDGTSRMWQLGPKSEAEELMMTRQHPDAVELLVSAGALTATATATWPQAFVWGADGVCLRQLALGAASSAATTHAAVTLTAGGLALAADGSLLAASRSDGQLVIVNKPGGEQPNSQSFAVQGVAFVSFVTINGAVKLVCSVGPAVALLEPGDAKEIRKIAVGSSIVQLATLPASSVVAAATDSKVVTLDVASGKVLATFAREAAGSTFQSFELLQRAGKPWLLSYEEGTDSVLLREAEPAGAEELALDGQGVTAASCSADGQLLALGTEAGSLVVWNLDAGVERSNKAGAHTNAIDLVSWSSNGQWLVTGGQDGAVKVWFAAQDCRLAGGHVFDCPISALAVVEATPAAIILGLRTGEVGLLRLDAAAKVSSVTALEWGSDAEYGQASAQGSKRAARPPDRLRKQTVQAASGAAAAAARASAAVEKGKKPVKNHAQPGAGGGGGDDGISASAAAKGGCCVLQ